MPRHLITCLAINRAAIRRLDRLSDEVAKLRCCDVNFNNSDYVKFIIASSKADVYRDGSEVLLARKDTVTCLYTILSRYCHLAALNCNSSDFVFRSLVYHKSTLSYSIGSRPISYSRARELLLNSLVRLLAVCFSLEIFSRDYEETLFSLKENGTRHGPYSAILLYRSLAFAMTKHSSKP